MVGEVKEVIKERRNTHGNFTDTCEMTQELVRIVYAGGGAKDMNGSQAESVHMICHKLARIACGDPNFEDHWVDIAGYAQLVVNQALPKIAGPKK
jgi:hypothetical protein